MRYDVARSSWFDSNPYRKGQIAKLVFEAGGSNVRTARTYGWSNQPEVVTFSADPSRRERIADHVARGIRARFGVIIHEKDW